MDAWTRNAGVHSTSQQGATNTHPATETPYLTAFAHTCAATKPPKLTPPTKIGTGGRSDVSFGYLLCTSLCTCVVCRETTFTKKNEMV
jgi:hypothetical protein